MWKVALLLHKLLRYQGGWNPPPPPLPILDKNSLISTGLTLIKKQDIIFELIIAHTFMFKVYLWLQIKYLKLRILHSAVAHQKHFAFLNCGTLPLNVHDLAINS